MTAIEFASKVFEGKIVVPESSGLQDGQRVRVLILIDDSTTVSDSTMTTREEFWKRTEGSWVGAPLVRDDQGEYPVRLELE